VKWLKCHFLLEYLPSKSESLSSNPLPKKKKKKTQVVRIGFKMGLNNMPSTGTF
jgi:hypothetical protein